MSEIASHFNVSNRTIRYYEEIGLLKPERTKGGQRQYSKKEFTQLQLIFRGKKYGFQLDEIKEMILLFDKDPTGKEQLKRTIEYGEIKIQEVSDRIDELIGMRREMEQLVDDFKQNLGEMGE
ncbi:MerR family transcriptional regulator [Virgibacillus doumboii]|uniref:MerR family transcriptional regulator n=1 Tax=Virgibacillus doumboii TaxID=2697503 RepID=UPI003CCD0372